MYMDDQFVGDVEMESDILNMGNDFIYHVGIDGAGTIAKE